MLFHTNCKQMCWKHLSYKLKTHENVCIGSFNFATGVLFFDYMSYRKQYTSCKTAVRYYNNESPSSFFPQKTSIFEMLFVGQSCERPPHAVQAWGEPGKALPKDPKIKKITVNDHNQSYTSLTLYYNFNDTYKKRQQNYPSVTIK